MTDPRIPAADALFEHAACGLIVTAQDGMILKVNATFCAWVGYSASELVGVRRVQELFTMGGRVFHQTHWTPLLQMQGSVSEVKFEVVHKSGQSLPMLLNAARYPTHDVVAGFIAKDRHIYERELLGARTELSNVNSQLAEADRRKDEFLATLAHELRNPLAPIQNVAQMMLTKALVDPQLVWARDVLERQVEHMRHLIDDLLDVSRITQGKLQLRREVLDLRAVVIATAETMQPQVTEAGHRLSVELPDRPLVVKGDATRLTQIVQNLLNNAIKYTPHGGTISIRASADAGDAEIAVADSGIGIPAEKLGLVFEMFTQLTGGLDRAQGGLGIGLSLVKALVQLHAGTIAAHSDGAGRGATFTVRIPLSTEIAPAAEPSATAARDVQRRILVVDDNEDALATLAMLLEMRGHVVRTAANGASALAAGEDFAADLVVLDIGLPDMDGYDVARQIRSRTWGMSVLLVALSGWGQDNDRERAFAAGFDHHLTKPLDRIALDRLLAGEMRKSSVDKSD